MVVSVDQGISKPYMDNQGFIWVKSGSDKRKVTAREELQRMYQEAALVHTDEIPVPGTSVSDLDREFIESFFEQFVGEPLAEQEISLAQLMENMDLMIAKAILSKQ